MKIVHSGDMPFVERHNPRGGLFHAKRLIEGEAGDRGNFLFIIGKTFGDFFSPRHRHNFDQVRVQLEGTAAFGRDGDMQPGAVGYFPEGTPYGPQTCTGESVVLVLQFGGASGNGYMSEDELQGSVAALKQHGDFNDGVYRRHGGKGRKNQDAYEAAWENWSGRKLVYPSQRYQNPILMDAGVFEWVRDPQSMGVEVKHLGEFTERRTTLALLRLAAGAQAVLPSHSLFFVMSGRGRLGRESLKPQTAVHLGVQEAVVATADEPIELLRIGLPYFGPNASRPAERAA